MLILISVLAVLIIHMLRFNTESDLDETNLDVESLTSNDLSSLPLSMNSESASLSALSSALKTFAPPTPLLPTVLKGSDSIQEMGISSHQNTEGNSPRPKSFSPALPMVDATDTTTSSLVEIDKTISALQKELDSVSQSYVTESNKNSSQSNILDSSGMNNISIIKRLQDNFKDASDLVPQSSKELDLIKTIQDTIASRVSEKTENVSIKEEVDIMPSTLAQAVYKQETDNKLTTDRLQQLMSSLSNNSPKSGIQSNNLLNHLTTNSSTLSQLPSLAPINTSALSSAMLYTTSLNTNPTSLSSSNSTGINNSVLGNTALTTSVLSNVALNTASLSNAALNNAALNSAASMNPSGSLNQLSMSPGSSPGLKGGVKKNPLSMLHLQGSTCSVADQAAILSVLYNERNLSQAS